jgi:PIN domain nuclease of toxin-antitoxin system
VILFDTCAAIWAVTADPSRRRRSRAAIAAAVTRKELHLSAVTAWEIAALVRRGRLSLAMSPGAFIDRLFGQPGVVECPVDREVASTAGSLADHFHGDPADRLIVATAIVNGLRLMTRDQRILRFANQAGSFQVQAC